MKGCLMMAKWSFFRGGCNGNIILVLTFLLAGNCVLAAGQTDDAGGEVYKFFDLKHISAEQGKQYLSKVVTGTVNPYPGSRIPTLFMTADDPHEIARAKTVLELVDTREKFVIKAIFPASAAGNMPSNEQIAAKLNPSLTRGASIGSFSNPPRKDASTRAIIDIHNKTVVVIAPVSLLERIVAVIGQPPSQKSNPKTQDKPKVQEKVEAPAKLKVSKLPVPNEAKFLLAASGAVETQPGAIAAGQAQEILDKAAADELPEPNDAAAGPSEIMAVPDGDDIVNLALADFEKLTIVQFLGLVGPYLQLDFLYDPRMLVGEVTISPNGKWRGPIKVKDLYPMLEEVLKFKDLAMTRSKGNLVTIVPVADALKIDPALLDIDKAETEPGDGIVQRVFKLKHIDAASAQNLLTSMSLTTNITPIAETKTLIVTGYAYRMPRIQALLNIVDRAGEPKKFRFRQLRYTMAEILAPKLQSLAEQLGTIAITVTQTSSSARPATTRSKPKGPTETTAQYQARLRRETAARNAAAVRARTTAARTPTTTQQPEPGKPTVYLDADERTNRILMIGLDEQLDEVEELIDTLDVVQQDLRTLELYKIEHVDAEEVKNKLEELGIITPRLTSPYSSRLTGGTKPGTTTAGAARTPTSTRTPMSTRSSLYGETEEVPGEEPQVVVVEQTNSLLVNATAEQHTKIAQILSYVDSEMLDSDIPVQLYPLENQSPEHLAQVLEKLIQETIEDKDGKIEKIVRKQDEQIIVVPEPNTYSLIVYASKKNQDWISNIIKNLDKRRPQVLIDVTLVQISKVDTFEYDLNLLSSFPDLTETAGLVGALEPTNLVPALMSANRDRFIDFQSQGGAGRAFYGDKHINALLTAVQTKSYGRVLAKPKILVNDNELGKIEQIKTTYIERTGSTLLEGNSVGVQTSQEFEGYEEGIKLEITPHISSGDLLRLDVLLTRSDFAEGGPSEKPPDIENNDIDTTVTVPDGSTIILGGLTKLDQNKAGSKVPLLGDLPLVGGLFRSANNTDRGDNMYVFIKAEIIRPSESKLAQSDLERISERNRTAFEEHETEFQENHDWPGVKPKPMKPLKVLDAQ
ncbi:MAG: hypothetical protein CEE38_03395 [Planctomycetes bacterium B3_Pla]|nr:MAG: hypothetical protein CEE38_03395 [Planctomycetes bacterium B3_Pla]